MVVYVYLLIFYKYCLFLFVNIFDNIKDALILDQANLQLYWDCLNSLFIIVYSSVFNVLGKNQRILNFNLVIN